MCRRVLGIGWGVGGSCGGIGVWGCKGSREGAMLN